MGCSMKTPFALSADQLAELVSETVQVAYEQGIVIVFAARCVAFRRFSGEDDQINKQREDLVDLIIQGVNIPLVGRPEILAHIDAHCASQPEGFQTSFVAHASEAFEREQERNYVNFHRVAF